MVGHPGKAHRAEVDRLEPPQLGQAVLGHHAPGACVDLAAPVEVLPLELDPEATPGRLQHPDAFGQHLLADTVAGNHRDSMLHRTLLNALR